MKLNLTTWNAHAINDTTNYTAVIQPGNAMPAATPNFISAGNGNPVLSGKIINGGYFTFNIILRGNVNSQRDELNKWFVTTDFTYKTLVAQDQDDSNREWYLEGFVIVPPVLANNEGIANYAVTLALIEPYWRTVVTNSDPWAITASGQTNVISVLGNFAARPIFTITPTSAKVGGYLYAEWKPWYNPYRTSSWVQNNEPLEVTNGGLNTAALVADTTTKVQINVGGGISAVLTTIPYDTMTGTMPSSGMAYVDTEQITYTGKTGTTSGNLTGCVRGVNGTTAATHADNAVIYRSKLMANGYDLRVYVNGEDVDRWLSGMNSAATKIWINQKTGGQPDLILGAAIASSGTITSITVKDYGKNTDYAMRGYPSTFLVAIGTEVFTCTAANVSARTFTVTGTRGARGTTAAAHAIGDRILYIENDIYIVYGNQDEVIQVTDDTLKPMINLSTSTNTSWVWADFWEPTNTRTAAWKPSKTTIYSNTYCYTATQKATANPASVMGITLGVYGTPPRIPYEPYFYGSVNWRFSHPAGCDTVTMTGSKYRYSSSWPSFGVTVYDGQFGSAAFVDTFIFQEATPSSSGAWGSISSHSAVDSLDSQNIAFTINGGTFAATANNTVSMEISDATVALVSANCMQLLAVVIANSTYYMDSTIANSSTGTSISVKMPMELNKTMIIDCDAETVVYNGLDVGLPIRWNSIRRGWLDIEPGSNTITFTDTGTIPGITCDITWEDRNTL